MLNMSELLHYYKHCAYSNCFMLFVALIMVFKYANDYIKELEIVNFIKLNSNEKYMTSLKMINGYDFYVVCLCCSIELHRLINDINTSYT